ncbi:MAG: cell division protein ZapA [Treponema sp.]|nr:cell division protein ZapA [Treponema sp.]MDE6245645.1 cell division protein ZapA [Treponemataceae bacterium]MBD5404636.1 cell division protein ZapA [Treponema sp.]MBD5407537.1 cell division protein ZapA [Treponema sp.]MBD5408982.1 cell division protein ZapA [Treponema sp.]
MGTLRIDMLGTSFTIENNYDSEFLNQLLTYYKHEVNAIEKQGNLKDDIQIAIMAGISMCEEVYKDKMEKQKTQLAYKNDVTNSKSTKVVDELLKKLDSVL